MAASSKSGLVPGITAAELARVRQVNRAAWLARRCAGLAREGGDRADIGEMSGGEEGLRVGLQREARREGVAGAQGGADVLRGQLAEEIGVVGADRLPGVAVLAGRPGERGNELDVELRERVEHQRSPARWWRRCRRPSPASGWRSSRRRRGADRCRTPACRRRSRRARARCRRRPRGRRSARGRSRPPGTPTRSRAGGGACSARSPARDRARRGCGCPRRPGCWWCRPCACPAPASASRRVACSVSMFCRCM